MPGSDEPLVKLGALLAAQEHDVPALLREAREEARARVRSLLVQAYTDALMQQVSAALVPENRAAPAAPPASHLEMDQTPGELGWYVYCVVDADRAPVPSELPGIAPGHPVSAVSHGDIAALVSRVSLAEFDDEPLRERLADMAWLERTARAHESVLDEITSLTTPVPMRLCTIFRDEAGVRAMLERDEAGLRHALTHLAGKLEWGVKAFGDPQAPAREPVATPSADDGGQGAAYMTSRLTQRRGREQAQRQLEQACESIHAALCAVSVHGLTSAPQRPEVAGRHAPMILNGSYLVHNDRRDSFHREVDRLRAEFAGLGIELEPTGPWPPYNFVPDAIGAAC